MTDQALLSEARGWSLRTVPVWPVAIAATQLALLLFAMDVFDIEQGGLLRLWPLILGGFVVNAVLPLAYRPAFFVGLSVLGLAILWHWGAAFIVGTGLVLIGVVHLPLGRWIRIAIIAAIGGTIAAFWSGTISVVLPGWITTAIPILASIFMFRLAIYFYDVEHETRSTGLWHRLAYFFMLPNAAFFLFPVVDYQKFRDRYYGRDAVAIYERGITLLFRGFTHLLIYRILYYYVVPNETQVLDLWSLALFMVGAYLLYIKIAGLFHIILGTLCLFGFDVPEAHNRYLLATGFNDFWRRARIDWREFMMKVFYYPILMLLRHSGFGMTPALVISTALVFVISFLLHSYQWFWLLGDFPMASTDAVFWGTLGSLVVVNSVLQLRGRGRASISERSFSWRAAIIRAAKSVGVLVTISVLWSIWSAPTLTDWWHLVGRADGSSALDWLGLAAVILAIVAAGAIAQFIVARQRKTFRTAGQPWIARGAVAAFLVALALIGRAQNPLSERGDDFGEIVASLRVDRLTEYDQYQAELGYYDELTTRNTDLAAPVPDAEPPSWRDGHPSTRVASLERDRLIPSTSSVYKWALFETNRWGQRDKDYELVPPPGTFRIALVGGSVEEGGGVRNDEVFEAIVEARLNADLAGTPGAFANYEIINFSVRSQTPPAQYARMDEYLSFDPDMVLVVAHQATDTLLISNVTRFLSADCPNLDCFDEPDLHAEYLAGIVERAGIQSTMSRTEIEERLAPFALDILESTYAGIAARAYEAGALPVLLFLPSNGGFSLETLQEDDARGIEVAAAGGLVTLIPGDIFAGYTRRDLNLAAWDNHYGRLAHRLAADGMYDLLLDNAEELGLVISTN